MSAMIIHRVKTRLVNSYVIEYPDRLLVMDVAVRCHRQLLGFVESELKRPISDVELVVSSHDDPDHMGGVAATAQICEAKIAIPYSSRLAHHKFLNDPTGSLFRFGTSVREAFRMRSWDMYVNTERDRQAREQPQLDEHHGEVVEGGLQEDFRLKHQQTLPGFDDWQVIHTPGHSWDSCCYYHAASGSLISGDTLLGSGKQNRLVLPSIYSNPLQMRKSLRQLRQLQVCAVYPGHGSVIEGKQVIGQVRA
jgi:glyoxylase-like metal-dependent hydrolase (beta-lactamase superfamily II)